MCIRDSAPTQRYNLRGESRVSADDCGPIIAWIQDEKARRKRQARREDRRPPEGISNQTMERLVAEHLPHIYQ